LYTPITSRMSNSPFCRAVADIAGKRSRLQLFAASTAVAGILSAAGLALTSAPSSEAAGATVQTVQSGSHSSGQPGNPITNAIAGVKAANAKSAAAGQLSALPAGGAASSIGAQHQAVKTDATIKGHAAQPATLKPAAVNPAVPKPAALNPAAPKPAALKPAAPKPAAKPRPVTPAPPAKPYLIYDSVSPAAIPHGQAAAVYVNGAYAANWGQVAGRDSVLWIDTNGSNRNANVLDVEPGDATPVGAAQWVQHRLTAHSGSVAIVYTMMSDWQQVKDNMATIPAWMQGKVRYWIADPTGVPHIVPGASATQWYWGSHYDITTAASNFTR
jgi:hypothetical protein